MSKTKQDFLTVSTNTAARLIDKNGRVTPAAYVLQILHGNKYPTPDILREVWALAKEYAAAGLRVPEAFVFSPR